MAKQAMLDCYVQATIERHSGVGLPPMSISAVNDALRSKWSSMGMSTPMNISFTNDIEPERDAMDIKRDEFRNLAKLNGKVDTFHQVLETHNDE
jgi:hypothetical protein